MLSTLHWELWDAPIMTSVVSLSKARWVTQFSRTGTTSTPISIKHWLGSCQVNRLSLGGHSPSAYCKIECPQNHTPSLHSWTRGPVSISCLYHAEPLNAWVLMPRVLFCWNVGERQEVVKPREMGRSSCMVSVPWRVGGEIGKLV